MTGSIDPKVGETVARIPGNDNPLEAANDHSPIGSLLGPAAALEAWCSREPREAFAKLRVNQADREVWTVLQRLLETHDLSSTFRAALALALDYLARNPAQARRLVRELETVAASGVRRDPRRKRP